MKISDAERAEVLVKALPYIQKYYNKTFVIKYGGSAMLSGGLKAAVIEDIVLLSLVGINVVLVHGGGPEITEMHRRLGKEVRFVNGLRCTDGESMEIVQMVLAGKVNKELVRLIGAQGGRALGLCGLDGDMIRAEKKKGPADLGFVGDITAIDPTPLNDAIEKGYIPVVASVASGDGNISYNINADSAAAAIAAALSAEKLLLLTDSRGLLRDANDENSLISCVNVSEVPALKKQKIVSGGMIPKLDCCVEAVRRGVSRTHILDGRIPHSILIEVFSNEGIGTMFV